jgi:hypothetical protein
MQSQIRTKQVEEKVLMQLESICKKHKEKESYLYISFSEDVRLSHGELLKVLNTYKNK